MKTNEQPIEYVEPTEPTVEPVEPATPKPKSKPRGKSKVQS